MKMYQLFSAVINVYVQDIGSVANVCGCALGMISSQLFRMELT